MKKISLAILLIFLLAGGGLLLINGETIALSMKGYHKTCGVLPDGEYCNYCKCETGEGWQGIPSYQCDDGSKPTCISSLNDLSNNKQAQFEKACVTSPDETGNVTQSCQLCRCVTGQPVNAKMPGSLYQCDDGSIPECVDEEKK